jgi:hypothetical protein
VCWFPTYEKVWVPSGDRGGRLLAAAERGDAGDHQHQHQQRRARRDEQGPAAPLGRRVLLLLRRRRLASTRVDVRDPPGWASG